MSDRLSTTERDCHLATLITFDDDVTNVTTAQRHHFQDGAIKMAAFSKFIILNGAYNVTVHILGFIKKKGFFSFHCEIRKRPTIRDLISA